MADAGLSPQQVLTMVPQQPPFRFLDALLELDEHHIVGQYTFRADEPFYAGHFPDEPITPGVILLEAMAQTGVVALGIYLMSLEVPVEEIDRWKTMFTEAEVEFTGLVRPQQTVTSHARRVFWRRRKLRAEVTMRRGEQVVAQAQLAGMGVRDHG